MSEGADDNVINELPQVFTNQHPFGLHFCFSAAGPLDRCAKVLSVSMYSPPEGFDYMGLLRLLALASHETTWPTDTLLKSGQKAALQPRGL